MSNERSMPYVVRRGDFLDRIAHRAGVPGQSIWQNPRNAALRTRRGDPNQLVAGDVLHLPAPRAEPPAYARGAENTFRARAPRVAVSVGLHGVDGAPLRDAAYRVVGVDVDLHGSTDAQGVLRCEVPVTTATVTVTLPELGASIDLWIGDLDPLDTESGVRQRLANLGHLHPELGEPDDELLASAVRCFQRAEGMRVTGALDDATRDAIGARYTAAREEGAR